MINFHKYFKMIINEDFDMEFDLKIKIYLNNINHFFNLMI